MDILFHGPALFVGLAILALIAVLIILSNQIKEKERQQSIKKEFERMRLEFSSNVTHEMKTPLQAIVGFADFMCMGVVDEKEIKNAATQIKNEAFRLNDLIDNVMRISELSEKTDNFEITNFDLYDVANRVVCSLEGEAQKLDILIKIKPRSDNNTVISGAENSIEILIYNLCENAIKYNKTHGYVDVSVESIADKNSLYRAELRVTDNGIGIPEDEQNRIFEMFYRIDKSHSRKLGGNGLGLGLVKLIAAKYEAKVLLESNLDRGTTIRVLFK